MLDCCDVTWRARCLSYWAEGGRYWCPGCMADAKDGQYYQRKVFGWRTEAFARTCNFCQIEHGLRVEDDRDREIRARALQRLALVPVPVQDGQAAGSGAAPFVAPPGLVQNGQNGQAAGSGAAPPLPTGTPPAPLPPPAPLATQADMLTALEEIRGLRADLQALSERLEAAEADRRAALQADRRALV